MLLPVGALVFSRVTFAGLALNFAAIPLMAVAQIAGMARRAAGAGLDARWRRSPAGSRTSAPRGWCGRPIWSAFAPVADLARGAAVVARRRASTTRRCVGRPGVGVERAAARRAAARARVAALGAAPWPRVWILVEPWTLVAARGDGRLHVTFIDVGQGDAAFVRFPRGSTLLVDAGGLVGVVVVRHRRSRRRAGAARRRRPAARHARADARRSRSHRRRRVDRARVPAARGLGRHSGAALRAADARCGRRRRRAGARWANVYARRSRRRSTASRSSCGIPAPADWERQEVRNDDSIVLELRWRDVSIVLTGDIGKAVERAIAAAIRAGAAARREGAAPRQPDVEHARRSCARCARRSPSSASAGATTSAIPRRRCCERYRDVGAEIFRTDQDGAVTIDTDGTSIDVRTFTGRTLSGLTRRR